MPARPVNVGAIATEAARHALYLARSGVIGRKRSDLREAFEEGFYTAAVREGVSRADMLRVHHATSRVLRRVERDP